MASTIDKVKHALHLDKDKSTSTTHTAGTTGHNTTGTIGHSGTAEGVAGPHSSRTANAADPRVDSDLDGSRNAGAAHNTHNTTGSGLTGNTHSSHTTGSGLTGNTHSAHTTGSGLTGNNHGSTNAGPHSSNVANKLDPRIDSDLDSSRTGHTGVTGHSTTGTGVGSTGYSGTHTGNNHGTHTGTTGGLSNSTNAGPHNSNALNKADPRVDSDLDGRGNRHGASTGGLMGASGSHATAGSGTAQNTAGPHNSDMLNKIDPRVDSDRDGSKTVGGNKTHA